MQKRLSITSNVKWLSAANLIVKPFWFAFLLISTRILGAEDFGLYMYAVSFVAVIAIFVECGVDIHTVRRLSIAENLFPRFVTHSLLMKIAGSIIVGIVTWMALVFIKTSQVLHTLFILAVLYSMFNAIITHARAIFRAFEIMQYEAISIVAEKGCVIVFCLASVIIVNNAVSFMVGFVVAYFIAGVITLWLLLSKIGWPRCEIDFKYLWQEIIKPAFPFALLNVFTVIYFRSGTLMISALTGKEHLVGYFNAGYRLVESYMLFPAIIAGSIYPVLVRSSQSKVDFSHILLYAVRAVLFISVIIVLPIFIYRTEFTFLFFGNDYKSAGEVVGIVVLSMIPVGMNFIFGTLVAASGRQRIGNYFIVSVTIINVSVNYLLIPLYGIAGAAVTTVLTEGLLAFANIWVVRDYIPWSEFSKILTRIIIPVLFILILSRAFPVSIGFPFNAAIVTILLILLFSAVKIVSVADIRKILSKI